MTPHLWMYDMPLAISSAMTSALQAVHQCSVTGLAATASCCQDICWR